MPRQTAVNIGTRISEEQLALLLHLGQGRSKSAIVLEALQEWAEKRGQPLPHVALAPPGKRPGAGRPRRS